MTPELLWSGVWSEGRLIDVMLALVAVEVLVVAVMRQRKRRGPPMLPFLCNVLAGACLMLALREAFHAQSIPLILVLVSASGLFHLLDLYFRWVRPSAGVRT